MDIYAPNELLAYAFDAYHRNNADDLGNVILNFYDDVAVRTAKTLIYLPYPTLQFSEEWVRGRKLMACLTP